MGKKTVKTVEAGIDVSKEVLDIAVRRDGEILKSSRFDNDAPGHRKLIRWLTRCGRSVRVVLESTGTYSLDIALALHGANGIAVMVANPRAVKQFTGALMQRSKTDVTAAVALREYAIRMPFVTWQPPAAHVLHLRAISRRIAVLVSERTRECNRLHALNVTTHVSQVVRNDIEVHMRHLGRRIEILTAEAATLIRAHSDLRQACERLVSVPGIATHTAIQLLPELLVLPCGMTARQWVAHAGLDPRAHQSGTSVDKPTHISKVGNARIRRALYMPALTAVQHNANVRAFFDKLLVRKKTPLQAYVAVMRKLLHAIHGMFATETTFIAAKFHEAA